MAYFVIPGRAEGAGPESRGGVRMRGPGFRVRSLCSRPGM